MASLLQTLQSVVNTANANHLDQIISECLLGYLGNSNFKPQQLNINQIAEDCYISPSSISRFARNYGFAKFSDFKDAFSEIYLGQRENRGDVLEMKKWIDGERNFPISKYADMIQSSVQRFSVQINENEIENLCARIHESTHVSLFASHLPGNIAEFLQYMFLTIGKTVHHFNDYYNNESIDRVLDKNSLSIVLSLEGSFVDGTRDLIFKLLEAPAPTVIVTQNPNIKLLKSFDEVILLGDHDHERMGKYKLMLFTEILFQTYCSKYVV